MCKLRSRKYSEQFGGAGEKDTINNISSNQKDEYIQNKEIYADV